MKSRDLDPYIAKYNGWYPTVYDGCIRIVIPATGDKTEFWQARAIDDKWEPRYDSPPNPKRETVVFIAPARIKYDLVASMVLVEGPMDALAAAGEKVLSIALMGNNPTNETLHLTNELITGIITRVLILEDRDSPGRLAGVMAYFATEMEVRLASCPSPWKDLAAMPKEKRGDLIRSHLSS